jgi:hypothetical protein
VKNRNAAIKGAKTTINQYSIPDCELIPLENPMDFKTIHTFSFFR